MSHFVTVVLVPSSGNPEDDVSGLLEPYDENAEVEPYEQQCSCVGRKAKTEARIHARVAAEKSSGTDIDGLRSVYWAMNETDRPDWNNHISAYASAEAKARDEFLSDRDDRDAPDAECEQCGGTGTETVTYNPKGKWDWFRIGGRWDGWIQGAFRESEDSGFNSGDGHTDMRHNCVSAEVYLQSIKDDENLVPFALVTPDGEWHEKAEMGWFGMTRNEVDECEWRDEVISLLEANPDTIAIAVDLHV